MASRWNPLAVTFTTLGVWWVARRMRASLDRTSFRGKVVIITGGSRGLGLAMAREFARADANVVLCARDAAELERAEQELRQHGARVTAIPCDVTSREKVQGLVSQVMERFGRVDVLVNNAGIMEVGPVESMTVADFEEAARVHYFAPLYTALEVLPIMKQQGDGRIVNISSIGGKVAVPHMLPYTASKFALVGLSEGLRAELAGCNIKVTTVCPGLVRTGSATHALFKGRNEQEYAWFGASSVLPFTTISAESAARQIVEACRLGRAEVVLSVPAWILAKLHALAPGLTTRAFELINRLLPPPGGIGQQRATGEQSGAASGSWFSTRVQATGRLYNQ